MGTSTTTARRVVYAALAALVLAGGAALASGRDDASPADAERISTLDGAERLSDVWAATVTGEGDVPPLDDVDLGTATYLRTDEDGDLILHVEGYLGGFDTYLVQATVSGELVLAGPITGGLSPENTLIGVSSDRHYADASSIGDSARVYLGSTPWMMAENVVSFSAPPPMAPGGEVSGDEAQVAAVDVVDRDTVLLGGRSGPYIDERSADGSGRRLLGPEGDPDALVTTDAGVGAIVSLVRQEDGRVVFVAESDDGYRLYRLDEGGVEPLADGGAEGNPVAAPDAADYPVHHRSEPLPESLDRRDVRAMAPLTPGPAGTVVTVGAGEDRVPEISLVDVDTGEVEVLARLDGVDATIEEPVLATVTGNDLVFTAEGSLWHLADAVPSTQSDGESDSAAARP